MEMDRQLCDERFLLQLFEGHVKNQLKETLRPQLEKILNSEVEKAVASMQASIETAYQFHNSERLVRIILEDKRDK